MFPPRLGRAVTLSDADSVTLDKLIKERLRQSDLRYPTLYTFSRIAEEITNRNLSISTMSRFCAGHKLVYDSPQNKKRELNIITVSL